MDKKIIMGIGAMPREYVINGVKYIVSSRFQKADAHNLFNNLNRKMERCVKSDFTHLTSNPTDGIILSEYVCSAAQRKEHK